MRTLSRGTRRCAATGDDGVSLLEVIVALAILAGISLAAVSGLLLSEKASRVGRDRIVAVNLAAERIEELRALGALAVPIGTASTTVPVKGVPFTVTTTANWQTQALAPGQDRCVGTGQSTNVFVRATVQVVSPVLGTSQPVRSDTVLTPPAGAGTTTAVRVKLVTAANSGLAGRTVRLTAVPSGTVIPQQVTDSPFGCAVFPGLPSGTYRVTVDEPGFVSVTGAQSYVEDVVADAGQPPPLVIVGYDSAGAVSTSFAPVTGFSAPSDSPGLVLANQGLRPLGAIHVPGATSRTGLFPFSSGYQAWLGLCRDADPGAHGAPRTTVAVPPGSTLTNTATLPSGRVEVLVRAPRNSSGNQMDALGGQALTATNLNGNCTTPASTTPLLPAGHAQRIRLGATRTTNPDIGYLRVLLPYGRWQISADGRAPSTAPWPEVTVTPGAPSASIVLDLQ